MDLSLTSRVYLGDETLSYDIASYIFAVIFKDWIRRVDSNHY